MFYVGFVLDIEACRCLSVIMSFVQLELNDGFERVHIHSNIQNMNTYMYVHVRVHLCKVIYM